MSTRVFRPLSLSAFDLLPPRTGTFPPGTAGPKPLHRTRISRSLSVRGFTAFLEGVLNVYTIGAPAAPNAGSGFASAATLGQIASATRAQYSSFGGIMLWDASQAYGKSRLMSQFAWLTFCAANGRFDQQVKNLIATAGGGGGTTTTSTKTTTTSTSTKTTTTTTTTSKTTSTTSTTTTIKSGSCAGVAAWVSTVPVRYVL